MLVLSKESDFYYEPENRVVGNPGEADDYSDNVAAASALQRNNSDLSWLLGDVSSSSYSSISGEHPALNDRYRRQSGSESNKTSSIRDNRTTKVTVGDVTTNAESVDSKTEPKG